jgi:hypothetical protein
MKPLLLGTAGKYLRLTIGDLKRVRLNKSLLPLLGLSTQIHCLPMAQLQSTTIFDIPNTWTAP